MAVVAMLALAPTTLPLLAQQLEAQATVPAPVL